MATGPVFVEVRGVLFDMDGVLISSIGSVLRCWRQWAVEYGVPNAETYEIPHGVRAIDIVRQLRPDIDAEEGLRRIEDLELADTADIQVLGGARELLASLPPERWTIVTSATRRLMLGRLAAAGLISPKELVAADSVTHGKPHPEPYQRGAQLLGADPAECLVVEDAPGGVRAGKAAGCRVLGVLGTTPLEQLREAGADWVVTSLKQVSARVVEGGDLMLSFTPVA